MKQNKKLLKTVETAMLCALGVVFMLTVRFPLLPSAGFLEYDMGDIPVILATLLIGPAAGLGSLFFVCLIQSLTVSSASSWEGFLMHFIASALFILTVYFISGKEKPKPRFFASLVCGALIMTAVMIPLNLVFTPMYLGVPVSAVKELLLPAIIPFNLLKGGINALVTALVFYPLRGILTKSSLL